MSNKKILVTGGNGFIGSKIVDRLVSIGHKPCLLLRKNSNRERLKNITDKVKIFEADLAEKLKIINIFKKCNPDIILHLASYGVYSYSDIKEENVKSIIDANIRGTINLLYAVQDTDCKLVVNTGSCFEYGSSDIAFKEDSLLAPVNMYGVTKASATLFSQVFSRSSKFSLVTLRPFTAYGPGEDKRRFMSTIIRQCLKGENPTLTRQKIVRDYIYIEDVVDGYLAAVEFGDKLSGEIINISTGKGTQLLDITEKIVQMTNSKVIPDIGSFPLREGEVLSLVGDSQKAEKLLNFKAKYSLDQGIEKTIQWVKENG